MKDLRQLYKMDIEDTQSFTFPFWTIYWFGSSISMKQFSLSSPQGYLASDPLCDVLLLRKSDIKFLQ